MLTPFLLLGRCKNGDVKANIACAKGGEGRKGDDGSIKGVSGGGRG